MKHLAFFLLTSIIILSSCGNSKHNHEQNATSGDSANSALKEMLDNKHMAAMEKMGPIYNIKKRLTDTIANTKSLAEAKKTEFEKLIKSLDSADNSMRGWMHNFNPNKDSADQEKNRAYLESEIEKINKVDEQMNEVIEKSKDALKK